ncbi:hypothetical protein Lal_00047985 [Lupinus albus]|nr:hypothetical protein Lal_00047985 [Lupinus albus]
MGFKTGLGVKKHGENDRPNKISGQYGPRLELNRDLRARGFWRKDISMALGIKNRKAVLAVAWIKSDSAT